MSMSDDDRIRGSLFHIQNMVNDLRPIQDDYHNHNKKVRKALSQLRGEIIQKFNKCGEDGDFSLQNIIGKHIDKVYNEEYEKKQSEIEEKIEKEHGYKTRQQVFCHWGDFAGKVQNWWQLCDSFQQFLYNYGRYQDKLFGKKINKLVNKLADALMILHSSYLEEWNREKNGEAIVLLKGEIAADRFDKGEKDFFKIVEEVRNMTQEQVVAWIENKTKEKNKWNEKYEKEQRENEKPNIITGKLLSIDEKSKLLAKETGWDGYLCKRMLETVYNEKQWDWDNTIGNLIVWKESKAKRNARRKELLKEADEWERKNKK